MTVQEFFEQEVKKENDLYGASDDNLKKDEDGDYIDFLVSSKWEYFEKGYNKGIKQKYRIKKLEPPDFDYCC